MTDPSESPSASDRETLAAAFDRDLDPLAEYAAQFAAIDVDPFALFIQESLASREISAKTRRYYDRVFRQWKAFMADQNRHPACPNHKHASRFVRHELDEKGNVPATVKEKLRILRDAYSYWQTEPSLPHPDEYQPFELAIETTTFTEQRQKEFPQVSIAELQTQLSQVSHCRNLAVIVLQLKLGLRATELCNLRVADLSVDHADLCAHYSALGTHPQLSGRPNAVYVSHERDGNKSRRPRVLPLDTETRRVLVQWLLVRPDVSESTVFLSLPRHNPLDKQVVTRIWKDAFQPPYTETAEHRGITSHFGRHYFTTYWEVHQDLHRELVKYMRGDTPGRQSIEERATIDEYIHTYYEDIVKPIREDHFTLDV